MREIKFRAWDEQHNKMMSNHECLLRMLNNDDDSLFIGGVVNKDWYEPKLMQYSGVKDKNGVEIYEGDIVSIDSVLNKILITDIYFERGGFRYRHSDNSGSVLDFNSSIKIKGYEKITVNMEVIGNIHENKDML